MALPIPSSPDPHSNVILQPVADAFSITPHATNPLAQEVRGIYVGVSGNVTIVHPGGAEVQYQNLAAGIIHPIRATHVTAATATGIVGIV